MESSFSTESTATYKQKMPVWLQFWFTMVEPMALVFGIIVNILVVCIMPRRSVAVASGAKIYYVSIAAFDIYNLIVNYFIYTVVNDSFYIASSGAFFVNAPALNDAVCTVQNMGWYVCEIFSNYAVIAMMLERLAVVLFPLRAKSFLGPRFTLALLVAVVLPPWLALVPESAFVAQVVYHSTWTASNSYCGWREDSPLYTYVLWAFELVMFNIHEFVSAALVITLSASLSIRSANRKQIIAQSMQSAGEGKERATIVTMLTLALLNICVFLPVFFTTSLYYVFDTSTWPQTTLDQLSFWGRLFEEFMGVAHSLNFVVYIARIPTFRAEVGRLCVRCAVY